MWDNTCSSLEAEQSWFHMTSLIVSYLIVRSVEWIPHAKVCKNMRELMALKVVSLEKVVSLDSVRWHFHVSCFTRADIFRLLHSWQSSPCWVSRPWPHQHNNEHWCLFETVSKGSRLLIKMLQSEWHLTAALNPAWVCYKKVAKVKYAGFTLWGEQHSDVWSTWRQRCCCALTRQCCDCQTF